MPLRKLQETPTGWGFGYDGVRQIICDQEGHHIFCTLVPENEYDKEEEMIGVTLDAEIDDGAIIRHSMQSISILFKKEAKCWVDSGIIKCKQEHLNEYEIWLEGKEEDEYGFEPNPPIVVRAKDEEDALKKLNLPEGVKVKSIERVD